MTDTTSLSQASTPTASTLSKVASTAANIQLALRQAIEDCPERASKPRHLAKILGVDTSSAWRFWQVAYSDSAHEAMLHLSGETTTERFIQALASVGVNEHLCENARKVLHEFRQLVDEQIGDVGTLKLMIERASPTAFMGDRYSKSLYDSMRYWIGAYGRTAVWMIVRSPSTFDGLADVVRIRALQGLRTLEDERTYLINTQFYYERRDSPQWKLMQHAVEHIGAMHPAGVVPEGGLAVPVIADASSMNGRTLWRSEPPTPMNEVYMSGGRAGAVGESSFAFGSRFPACLPLYQHDPEVGIGVIQQIPYENLVLEYYVPDAEVRAGLVPRAQIYNISHAQPRSPGMLIHDDAAPLEHYRAGRPRTTPDDVENYSLLHQEAQRAANCELADHHLFRWRVKYPAVGMNYAMFAEGLADQAATPGSR